MQSNKPNKTSFTTLLIGGVIVLVALGLLSAIINKTADFFNGFPPFVFLLLAVVVIIILIKIID